MEFFVITSVISTDETLVSGSIKSKRSAHKLFKIGALYFTGHFIFNIVNYRIEKKDQFSSRNDR